MKRRAFFKAIAGALLVARSITRNDAPQLPDRQEELLLLALDPKNWFRFDNNGLMGIDFYQIKGDRPSYTGLL